MATDYSAVILADSPSYYWPFDTLYVSGGSRRTEALAGGTDLFVQDNTHTALNPMSACVAGSFEYTSGGNYNIFNNGNLGLEGVTPDGNWTYEFLVYETDQSVGRFIFGDGIYFSSSSYGGIIIYVTSAGALHIAASLGTIQTGAYGNGFDHYTADSTIATNTWYHIVIVLDVDDDNLSPFAFYSYTATIYINGVAQSLTLTPGQMGSLGSSAMLGSFGMGNSFTSRATGANSAIWSGQIDEFAAYTYGLDQDQVDAHYAAIQECASPASGGGDAWSWVG